MWEQTSNTTLTVQVWLVAILKLTDIAVSKKNTAGKSDVRYGIPLRYFMRVVIIGLQFIIA